MIKDNQVLAGTFCTKVSFLLSLLALDTRGNLSFDHFELAFFLVFAFSLVVTPTMEYISSKVQGYSITEDLVRSTYLVMILFFETGTITLEIL